jgi:hypothetical protein
VGAGFAVKRRIDMALGDDILAYLHYATCFCNNDECCCYEPALKDLASFKARVKELEEVLKYYEKNTSKLRLFFNGPGLYNRNADSTAALLELCDDKGALARKALEDK